MITTLPLPSIILPGDSLLQRIDFNQELSSDTGLKLRLEPFSITKRQLMAETSSDCTQAQYEATIRAAIAAIRRGEFQKVVLARQKIIESSPDFDPEKFFVGLSSAYAHTFRFMLATPDHGLWLGASPELLLCKRGYRYQTVALAGTLVTTSGKQWSPKEYTEQRYVTEEITENLRRVGVDKVHVGPVYPYGSGRISHLKTDIKFTFTGDPKTILGAIHPTAAMCGYPRSAASEFISAHEQFNRYLYSGYSSVEYPNGDLDAFVLIRCLQVLPSKLILYAGCGITEASDPYAEWLETEHKMTVMLDVLKLLWPTALHPTDVPTQTLLSDHSQM